MGWVLKARFWARLLGVLLVAAESQGVPAGRLRSALAELELWVEELQGKQGGA